jgi:hypothetical protein
MLKTIARILVLVCAGIYFFTGTSSAKKIPIAESEKKAVIQAIQDELYDEGCQGYGFDAAAEHGKGWYQLRAYVKPELDDDEGEVIYKFLPLGEVIRTFSIEPNGLAILYGHPEWHFPPTSPNYLTVYMNDDVLCRLKHQWLKTSFTVELKPTRAQLREAADRQQIRLGSRYRAHKSDCSFDWR